MYFVYWRLCEHFIILLYMYCVLDWLHERTVHVLWNPAGNLLFPAGSHLLLDDADQSLYKLWSGTLKMGEQTPNVCCDVTKYHHSTQIVVNDCAALTNVQIKLFSIYGAIIHCVRVHTIAVTLTHVIKSRLRCGHVQMQ